MPFVADDMIGAAEHFEPTNEPGAKLKPIFGQVRPDPRTFSFYHDKRAKALTGAR